MRMVAGFVAAHCATFAWLVILSMPADPVPSPPRDTGRKADHEAAMIEVRDLRERVRSLESLLATLQSARTPAPVVAPPAPPQLSAPALRETITVDERDLEVRAQQPVDWMALERFAGRWVGKDDERSAATLALVGPTELVSQFGPPSRIQHAGDVVLWTYESAEQDANGTPSTRIQFLVGHGSVLGVNRRSRP